jgi:F0F1-type ATP synthase membrane subunit b/b'
MLADIMTQMGINQSLFIHFILFAILLGFLKILFFNPLLKHLHKRDEKTTLLAEQIRELKTKCDTRIETYNRDKSKIQQDYAARLEAFQKNANDTQRKISAEGRAKALEKLSKHRESLAQEYKTIGNELILSLNDIKKGLDTHLC